MIQILFSIFISILPCIESIPNDTAMNRLYYYDHYNFCPKKIYSPPDLINHAEERFIESIEKYEREKNPEFFNDIPVIELDWFLESMVNIIG